LSRAASANGAPAGTTTTTTVSSGSSAATYQPAVQPVQEQTAGLQDALEATPSQTGTTQVPTPAIEQLQSSAQQPQPDVLNSQQTGSDADATAGVTSQVVGALDDVSPPVKTEGSNNPADLAFGDAEADGAKSPTGIL
jgi:hypothetical protein